MRRRIEPIQLALTASLSAVLSLYGIANAQAAEAAPPSLSKKVQPYIVCFNRLSERALNSRTRYLSWASKSGPTGKESIVYGLYSLNDPSDCTRSIEEANKLDPHDAILERAGTAYMKSLTVLTAVAKEANEYYEQGDYKDDKMAKGKQLHPKLMAAFEDFAAANAQFEETVEKIDDQVQLESLTAVEKTEGRKKGYYNLAIMIKAKALLRVEADGKDFDIPKVKQSIDALEASINDVEAYSVSDPDGKASSFFISAARSFLKSGKELMRRVRDKTPYSYGEKSLLGNSLSGWMVEGSPAAVTRNYNQLIERFNSRI